jgi:hypothetical protein
MVGGRTAAVRKSTPVFGGGMVFLAAPDIILEQAAEKRDPERASQFYAKNKNTLMASVPAAQARSHRRMSRGRIGKVSPAFLRPLYYNGRLYTFKDGGLVYCREGRHRKVVV